EEEFDVQGDLGEAQSVATTVQEITPGRPPAFRLQVEHALGAAGSKEAAFQSIPSGIASEGVGADANAAERDGVPGGPLAQHAIAYGDEAAHLARRARVEALEAAKFHGVARFDPQLHLGGRAGANRGATNAVGSLGSELRRRRRHGFADAGPAPHA